MRSVTKVSGAQYKSLIFPLRIWLILYVYSSHSKEEFKNKEGIPTESKLLTWSSIKAIKGEITTVSPEKIKLGIW